MKPNRIVLNDAVAALKKFLGDAAQVIAADPPYFQVQPRAWDRAVGYNERRDSFTPATEVILMLRKSVRPKFNNSAARESYDARTMAGYLRNPRYRDKAALLSFLPLRTRVCKIEETSADKTVCATPAPRRPKAKSNANINTGRAGSPLCSRPKTSLLRKPPTNSCPPCVAIAMPRKSIANWAALPMPPPTKLGAKIAPPCVPFLVAHGGLTSEARAPP